MGFISKKNIDHNKSHPARSISYAGAEKFVSSQPVCVDRPHRKYALEVICIVRPCFSIRLSNNSGSIKCGEFLDLIRPGSFLKRIIYKICISQSTTIFIQEGSCVETSDMFRLRVGHSHAHSNSKDTHRGRHCTSISFIKYREIKWNINFLNTKRRLLYLKAQFVPRSKHFSSRL